MTLVAATILCDRKADSQLVAVPTVGEMWGVDHYYVNWQFDDPDSYDIPARPLYGYKAAHPRGQNMTIELWHRSGWKGAAPTFDQDQARLKYIVCARNLAIDFAMDFGAEWLFFVDADVVPEPGGLKLLLESGHKLCGGLVPGRGAHSGARYAFNVERESPSEIICSHGTCGYMLIHRDIFSVLRFRYGPHIKYRQVMLSEDPAYCADAKVLGLVEHFVVLKGAAARHVGELKTGETAQY